MADHGSYNGWCRVEGIPLKARDCIDCLRVEHAKAVRLLVEAASHLGAPNHPDVAFNASEGVRKAIGEYLIEHTCGLCGKVQHSEPCTPPASRKIMDWAEQVNAENRRRGLIG